MMRKIFLIIAFALAACNNTSEKTGKEEKHEHQEKVAGLQLNNGKKWQTDDATRKNVAALREVLKDARYSGEKNRKAHADQLQQRLDLLIKECRMKGPDHDALHLWLENLLLDVKALRDETKDFNKASEAIHKDVGEFDVYFN